MQKKLPFIFLFGLFLTAFTPACRNNASSAPLEKNKRIIEETARLDSLAKDLEKTTKSIEEQARELEKAIDTL